jgi:hypothetical protein
LTLALRELLQHSRQKAGPLQSRCAVSNRCHLPIIAYHSLEISMVLVVIRTQIFRMSSTDAGLPDEGTQSIGQATREMTCKTVLRIKSSAESSFSGDPRTTRLSSPKASTKAKCARSAPKPPARCIIRSSVRSGWPTMPNGRPSRRNSGRSKLSPTRLAFDSSPPSAQPSRCG